MFHKYFYSMIVLFIALAGCGGAVDESNSNMATTAPSVFKVAMILPGPIDDQSWSQSGYEGLQLIEKELGAEVAYTADTSSMSEAEVEQLFGQYATDGYDFIIGHGGEYIPLAEMVAEEFPRTSFAVMAGYAGNNKNLGALVFRVSETGYLLGVVAALKSQTNKVAYIGGEPYPSLVEESTAFELGAKATNPSIEVSIEWVNSWVDVDKTRKLAQAQIDAGADVLMVSVDKASHAAFEAAQKAGVYAIASTWDQHELAPNTILSSNITRTPVVLLEGSKLVQQGLWEGKQYKFGLREGAVGLAPFYGLLTPEEEEKVNAVKNDILTGKIELDPTSAP